MFLNPDAGFQISQFLSCWSTRWLKFIFLRISSVTCFAPSAWYCWTIKSTVLILSAASSWQTGIGSDRRFRRRWNVLKSSNSRFFRIPCSRRITFTDSETLSGTDESTTLVSLDSDRTQHQVYWFKLVVLKSKLPQYWLIKTTTLLTLVQTGFTGSWGTTTLVSLDLNPFHWIHKEH